MKSLLPTIESSANALSKLSLSLHHSLATKLGTLSDTYTANNILNAYTKFMELSVAHRLFDEIPNRDTCSWNTIISGYVNHGNFQNAFRILKDMKRAGLYGDGYTFGSILKSVAFFEEIKVGQQVHSLILKTGFAGNVYSGSALLDMYAKCRRVEDAHVVFEFIPEPNKISWNALIAGYAQLGDCETAFGVLDAMERDGLSVDDGTFAPLLTLVNEPEMYKLAIQIHGKIVKHGLQCNNTVCNALITSYSSCGSLEDSQKVFDGAFGTRDLVTWNSMLAAYLEHDKGGLAVELFLAMQRLGSQPDIYTYTSIISGCSEDALLNHGRSLHGLVIKRGLEQSIPISNSLMAMYIKSNNKSMEDALSIFDSMESKDQVSWNSVLTGFSHMGMSEDALNFFLHMRSTQLEIDQFALSAVLKSCSDLAILQLGQQVHASVVKVGFELNEFVASSLIFMYSRCGIIDDARKSFEVAPKDTSITWNSIIFGYAQHGEGTIALDLFLEMRKRRVKLDHVTFVAVLFACSHIGMVDEGNDILKSMESVHGIPLRMEHYACAVDMFGRAGRLDEAKALVESMPYEPDAMVWKTLLGACRACGDIGMATQVASHLLEVDPQEHCTYVLLSGIYAHLRRWDDRASVTKLMRERAVKKVPGWSWIELQNEVHAFNAEDHSHPHCEEIYLVLEGLMEEIKRLGDGESLMPGLDHFDGYYEFPCT